jgi:hypothetical protein
MGSSEERGQGWGAAARSLWPALRVLHSRLSLLSFSLSPSILFLFSFLNFMYPKLFSYCQVGTFRFKQLEMLLTLD